MTRRRRSPKEIEAIKVKLAEIIRRTFDGNGQVITHDELARQYVAETASVAAAEEVMHYGGPAVAYLRREHKYAIVPITTRFAHYTGDPSREQEITDAVAGLGAGGPRIGWYHPSGRDDWLWVYYIGHLGNAGVAAVYHAADQADSNKQLLGAKGRAALTQRTVGSLPVPPTATEKRLLEARAGK